MEILVVHLRGPASLKFLHDVAAQDLTGLGSGQGALAAFLDDRGRVLAFGRVLAGEDECYVLADTACAEGIDRAIARIAPLAGVEVDSQTRRSSRFADSTSHDAYSWHREGDNLSVSPGWGEVGTEIIGDATEVPLGEGALATTRVTAGLPRFGVDINADTFVNETPLFPHAVSLSKGCYPGQESVARVFNLGQVKRKLRVVDVREGEVSLGANGDLDITSRAGSAALAWTPIAIEPGTELRLGSARVVVTDAGW